MSTPASPEQFLREFVYGWLVEVARGVYDHEDLPKLADEMLEEFAKLLELREQEARPSEQEATEAITKIFEREWPWIVIGYENAMREHGLPVYDYTHLIKCLAVWHSTGVDSLKANGGGNERTR